jgi:hypothetical protein
MYYENCIKSVCILHGCYLCYRLHSLFLNTRKNLGKRQTESGTRKMNLKEEEVKKKKKTIPKVAATMIKLCYNVSVPPDENMFKPIL